MFPVCWNSFVSQLVPMDCCCLCNSFFLLFLGCTLYLTVIFFCPQVSLTASAFGWHSSCLPVQLLAWDLLAFLCLGADTRLWNGVLSDKKRQRRVVWNSQTERSHTVKDILEPVGMREGNITKYVDLFWWEIMIYLNRDDIWLYLSYMYFTLAEGWCCIGVGSPIRNL